MSLTAHIKDWVTLQKLLIHVIEMASVQDTCKRDVRVAGNQKYYIYTLYIYAMYDLLFKESKIQLWLIISTLLSGF